MNKTVKKWRKQAEREGWTVEHTGSTHLMFRSPEGKTVCVPTSPGGGRSAENTRSLLKRAGLKVSLG